MMMIFAEYEDIFVLNFKASKGITRSQGLTQFFICWVFGWLVQEKVTAKDRKIT